MRELNEWVSGNFEPGMVATFTGIRKVDWRNENVVLGSNLMSEMVISLDARFLVLESTKLFLFFANKSGIVQ